MSDSRYRDEHAAPPQAVPVMPVGIRVPDGEFQVLLASSKELHGDALAALAAGPAEAAIIVRLTQERDHFAAQAARQQKRAENAEDVARELYATIKDSVCQATISLKAIELQAQRYCNTTRARP